MNVSKEPVASGVSYIYGALPSGGLRSKKGRVPTGPHATGTQCVPYSESLAGKAHRGKEYEWHA